MKKNKIQDGIMENQGREKGPLQFFGANQSTTK